jgi:hypothetical protein
MANLPAAPRQHSVSRDARVFFSNQFSIFSVSPCALAQTVGALNVCIVKRNELVEYFKISPLPETQKLAFYFGFPFGQQVNQEYSDTIEAIYRQTDDGIFFSSQLCSALSNHGDQLLASFKKRFGKGAPRIHRPDFAKAADADLMPNEKDYADWMSMFVKRLDRP